MNRITVCTCCQGRPEVLDKFIRAWQSLTPKPYIVIAGSPDDGCSEVVSRYSDVDYFQVPNKPVGAKWNAAHKRAEGTALYYLTTGSDDVMDQKMWEFYYSFTGQRLALLDLYFYNLPNGKSLLWNGYPERDVKYGYPIGAHQLTSFEAMEEMDFEPFNPKTMAHEFDTEKKCIEMGIEQVKVRMIETGGIGIDLKSSGSYSPFKQYTNSHFVDNAVLWKKAPELMGIITT